MLIKKIKNKLKTMYYRSKIKKKQGDIVTSEIKSICILLFNIGIGDAIISSGIFRNLKKSGFNTTIITNSSVSFIYKENEDIDNIIEISKNKEWINEVRGINFDLLIDFYSYATDYFTYTYLKVISKIRYTYCLGFEGRYNEIYNYNHISHSKKIHQTDIYRALLKKLEIYTPDLSYDLKIPFSEKNKATDFIKSLDKEKKIIAFCPFASTDIRSLSIKQIDDFIYKIMQHDNIIVIIIGNDEKICNIKTNNNIIINPLSSFYGAAAIIELCDLVISVDTSIVHLSNALNKKLISIYSSVFIREYNGNYLFSPNYKNAIQIISPSKKASDLSTTAIFNKMKEIL